METETVKVNNLILREMHYGSILKKVKLAKIASQVWKFKEDEIGRFKDNLTIGNALSKKHSVGYLGKEYQDVYLPCPPAHELFLKDYEKCFTENKNEEEFIAQSFIKVEGEKDGIDGFQSGKRSCIVPWNGKYYRLKGCGNLTQGFPLEAMQSYHPNAKDIRGCQFFNTALREQYMTQKITEILKKHEILCANIPVGVWKYTSQADEFKNIGLINECPLVDKYCGVFETLGEKRMATHLLQGIEVFLHYMIDNYLSEKLTSDYLIKLFPPERILEGDPENLIVPLLWIGPFLEIPEGKTIGEWTKDKIYPEDAFTQVFNLKEKLQTISTEVGDIFKIEDIPNLVSKFLTLHNLPSEYQLIIESLCEKLLDKNTNILEVLSLLYSRIGWECGKIKRIFQENDINWGYYADHDLNIYHCNAHPNNLVVLPESLSKNILGVLDFDLSSFRKDFINIDETRENYGYYSEKLFDIFLNCERAAFEQALSGDENMANFSYSLFKLESHKENTNLIFGLLKTILRDTCVWNYRRAYDQYEEEEMRIFDARNNEKLTSLINIALLITRDIVV